MESIKNLNVLKGEIESLELLSMTREEETNLFNFNILISIRNEDAKEKSAKDSQKG